MKGNLHSDKKVNGRSHYGGFSLLELLVVVGIILVAAAMAVPTIRHVMDSVRLREAGTDYSGILQRGRSSAVADNRYYSVLTTVQGGVLMAFVDTFPRFANGNSGNGTYDLAQREPSVSLGTRVTVDNVNAPAQQNLQNQVVPANSGVVLTSTTPSAVTFTARGLPCIVTAGPSPGSSTCFATATNPVAYATFLRSTGGAWEAVTVTPAGRINTWMYNGTTWVKL
jgi:prepilin-type N-terminal cleavage/methylation domain-containing protein